MKKTHMRNRSLAMIMAVVMMVCLIPVSVGAEETTYTVTLDSSGDFYLVTNPNGGETLSYAPDSGVTLLEVTEGGYTYAFKDLNQNGVLDDYEDWRLSAETRAENLTGLLTADDPIEKIAPLMMASMHFSDVSSDLDASMSMMGVPAQSLLDKGVRHILNAATSASTEDQVEWMNAMQKEAEKDADMFGIPVNIFSDPRSNAGATDGLYDGSSSTVSKWPGSLGFAATFDASYTEQFGSMASQEYRALGITTALSPQIDLATEPRWSRVSGTYGKSALLTADISEAYVTGFQSTYTGDGLIWSTDSVATMLKHWPGDGSGEGGRESHSNVGKYAVYPGDNLEEHLIPFTTVMDQSNKSSTTYAASVMPSYSIGIDAYGNPLGTDTTQRGSGVSKYKMTDLLNNTYDFGGYVCSDWGVAGFMADMGDQVLVLSSGTAWGTSDLGDIERIWVGFEAGMDMYGGLESVNAVKEAYVLAVEDIGKTAANEHFADSAYRILLSSFRLGLFENAYRNVDDSVDTVGNAKFNETGYEAQKASVVMLKNEDNVIQKNNSAAKQTVYIPLSSDGTMTVDESSANEFFNVVTDTVSGSTVVRRTDFTDVDFALLKVSSPQSPGDMFTGSGIDWDARNFEGSTAQTDAFGNEIGHDYDPSMPMDNGYRPKTLQYRKYYADPEIVRAQPLGIDEEEDAEWVAAGGEAEMSRYYGGTSATATNEDELDYILDTVEAVGDLPVVVYIAADSAMVFNEFESEVEGIVMGFGISDAAALEVISGNYNPTGLLPMQMPANMETVEQQLEDVAFDMYCHVDTQGNVYGFGYGLNWDGVIDDDRVATYVTEAGVENKTTETHESYLAGYPDGSFGTRNNMTRAEVAQMLYNVLEDKDVTTTATFSDVPAGAWYKDAVETLAGLGVISGYPDGTFRPNSSVTRAEYVSMATLFADIADSDAQVTFSDVEADDWYFDAVQKAVGNNWISGYPDGTFLPEAAITRAEAVIITNAMLGRSPDEDYISANAADVKQFTDLDSGHWAYENIVEATNTHRCEKVNGVETGWISIG